MEDDEDFEDFGGFEAAEPVGAAVEAQPLPAGLQAGPVPWVIFAASSSSQQPDLLQAQASAQSLPLDAPFPQHENGTARTNWSEQGEEVDDERPNFATFDTNFDLTQEPGTSICQANTQRSFSEQVLEPHFGNSGQPRYEPVPDGVLDLDLSKTSGEPNRSDGHPDGSQRMDCDVVPISAERRGGEAAAAAAAAVSIADADSLDSQRAQVTDPSSAESAALSHEASVALGSSGVAAEAPSGGLQEDSCEIQGALEETQKAKVQLQQELDKLLASHGSLEEVLDEYKQQVQEQKQTYQQLQTKHTEELDQLRQAGHDALTVVVDEYKELSRSAVLEQQVSSTALLKEALEQERQTMHVTLTQQHDKLKEQLDEEREHLQEEIQKALVRQQEEHKKQMQEELEKERQRSQDAIREALEKAALDSQKQTEVALQAEREKTSQLLKEERERLQEVVQAERDKSTAAVGEALEAQTATCKECMEAALREERANSEQTAKHVLEKSREQMKDYVQEQKQADGAVRRRGLVTMELFLDSARKQLELLLKPDDPPDPGSVLKDL